MVMDVAASDTAQIVTNELQPDIWSDVFLSLCTSSPVVFLIGFILIQFINLINGEPTPHSISSSVSLVLNQVIIG